MLIEGLIVAGLALFDFVAGVLGMFTFLILLVPYRWFLQRRSLPLILSLALGLSIGLEIWFAYPLGSLAFGVGLGILVLWLVRGVILWSSPNVTVYCWGLFGVLIIAIHYITVWIGSGHFPSFRPLGWFVTLLLGAIFLWLDPEEYEPRDF